jgi:serine phosphatase RsbU (regulator of sigma subunit)
VPRSLSLCDVTVDQQDTVVVPDTWLDDRFSDHPSVVTGPQIRAYLAHPLHGPGGETIGTLCVAIATPTSFTPEQVALIRDLAGWAEDELSLAQEMARATQVQRSLLPASLVSFPGYEIAGVSRPIRAVGGDFYDWYPVRGGVAITIADVMGKGMPAALIAAGVRAVMRANAPMHGVAAAVESAAEALETELDGAGAFVTLFHAHLAEQTGVVRYIDAGHGLTVVVRDDGTTERLGSTGMPIGANWDNTWDEATTRLAPGDTLVSVSDGVLDGLGGALDSLVALEDIVRTAPDATAVAQLVADSVGSSAPDDVSVVALRRTAIGQLESR